MKYTNRVHCASMLVLLAAAAWAMPSYTGYSGAPGTSGTCAGSCHGSGTGTIEVVGFPTTYQPSDTYVISVVHVGGATISNFNASVRIGTGPHTAGTITAGYLTSTYSTGNEPNGVHLTGSGQDSCTFNWQAPDSAVGDVKLYLAGLQDNYSGPNTVIILTSSPAAGVSEGIRLPVGIELAVEPTIAGGDVRLHFSARSSARPTLRVTDAFGRLVARLDVPIARKVITWKPLDGRGKRLPAGTYLVIFEGDGGRLVRKLVLQ